MGWLVKTTSLMSFGGVNVLGWLVKTTSLMSFGKGGKYIGLVGENYKLNVLRRGKGVNVMGWLVRPTRLATGLLRIRSQLREAQQRGNPEDRLIKNGYN